MKIIHFTMKIFIDSVTGREGRECPILPIVSTVHLFPFLVLSLSHSPLPLIFRPISLTSQGEAYSDPVKHRRQMRLKEAKKNIGKAWVPSSGSKKP